MIKNKPTPAADGKVVKLKVKKSATQTLHAKRYGQPMKALTQCPKRTPLSGPRRGPVKSNADPALSKRVGQEALKVVPKAKRAKGVETGDGQADGCRNPEDVETQMKIYQESLKGRQASIKIPSAGVDERLTLSPGAVIGENPNAPDVSTPFNRRLVSSTPDPDRLLELDGPDSIPPTPSHDGHLQRPLSPQMVPERDSAVDAGPKLALALSGMEALGRQQNQLAWHQRLAQHQHFNPISQEQVPKGQNGVPAAVYDLLRAQRSTAVKSALSNLPLTSELGAAAYPKAEWVDESPAHATETSSSQSSDRGSQGAQYDCYDSVARKNCDIYSAYRTFGASSSSQHDNEKNVKNHNFVDVQNLDSVEAYGSRFRKVLQRADNKSYEDQGNVLLSTPNSAVESDCYDKFACTKPPSAHNEQLSSQSNSLACYSKDRAGAESVRKAQTHAKLKSAMVKAAVVVDERGVDVPPSEAVIADLDVLLARNEDNGSANVASSLSANCSEVIKAFFSSDDINQNSAVSASESHTDESKCPGAIGHHAPASVRHDVRSESLSQNELSCSDKLAILDVLSDTNEDSCATNAPASLEVNTEVSNVKKSFKDNGYNDDFADVSFGPFQRQDKRENDRDAAFHTVPQVENILMRSKTETSGNGESVEMIMTRMEVESDEREEEGAGKDVNQNYHDSPGLPPHPHPHSRSGGLDLLHLDRMPDSTLYRIACRLASKASTLRDMDLQHLIHSMIFHTDSTLAQEDEKFQSSQRIFIDENNKLKKRIHAVNNQLEVKERLEQQAKAGLSNTDVMHLERKNLYLRQEKDRLDQQVTNLLEEKAKWLIAQQDLVKTVSLKDREILKLESKHQNEKKSLHQSLDQATKNSQGVHYKLSVADREIGNLEQRMKAKETEFRELKDKVRDLERDLSDNLDLSRKKEVEMSRLQDLVDTLKAGIDEVLKAYEASNHGREESEDRRKGIDMLRQMMTGSVRTTPASIRPTPAQAQAPAPAHHQAHADTHSRRPTSHSHSHRSVHPVPTQGLPPLPTQGGILDSSLPSLPAGRERDTEHSGMLAPASEGSSLTRQAVEEHNQRLSPINRRLWHSLDSNWPGPVIPLGEEPYYSDSEIQVVNSRERRRHDNGRLYEDPGNFTRHVHRRSSSSLSPTRRKKRGSTHGDWPRRNEASGGREVDNARRSKGGREREMWRTEEMFGEEFGEKFTSTRRDERGATLDDDEIDSRRDVFSKEAEKRKGAKLHHPDTIHLSSKQLLDDPMSSESRWREVADKDMSSGQQRSTFSSKTDPLRQGKDRRQIQEDETSLSSSSSLKSSRIPSNMLPPDCVSHYDWTINEGDASTMKVFTLSSDGRHFRSLDHESQPLPPQTNSSRQPLSSSYPSFGQSKHGLKSAQFSSSDPLSSLQSTSLPISYDQDQQDEIYFQRQPNRPNAYHQHPTQHHENFTDFQDFQTETSVRGQRRMLYSGQSSSQHSRLPPEKRTVTFHDQSDDSLRIPPQSSYSDVSKYRTSFPPLSSPVNTSDISISRRATRDPNSFQRDFFQGTELSASFSSISQQDFPAEAFDNSNNNVALDQDSFETGIASLDSKIARLQEKIDRTKAVFS